MFSSFKLAIWKINSLTPEKEQTCLVKGGNSGATLQKIKAFYQNDSDCKQMDAINW